VHRFRTLGHHRPRARETLRTTAEKVQVSCLQSLVESAQQSRVAGDMWQDDLARALNGKDGRAVAATAADHRSEQSKRSGEQCRKAAMKDKRVCRAHGGASTGPRSAEGRARCAKAKTIHGRETRGARSTRAEKLRELRKLERAMIDLGMIKPG
jgi:hypothetical protein